jgi:hypothetical protein
VNSTSSWRGRKFPEFFFRQLPLLALLLIIALGTQARLMHTADVSLWMDESWRIANLLDTDSLFTQMFVGMNRVDPPLFSLVIFLLGRIYNVEFVLRLVSLIPGILAIPLAYLAARQLFSNRWLAVMSSFLTAFTIELMAYSKELKPYSLCAAVHLCLLYGYLKYRGKITTRTTILFTALLALSIPLSLHSVFAFPGLYLALFAGVLHDGTRQQKKLVLCSCIALLLIAALSFFLLIGNVENDDSLDFMRGYWGDQLCPAESVRGALAWLAPRYLEHYTDIAFANRLAPRIIRKNLHLIYPAMALLGYIALLLRSRRRFFEACCLFIVPLAVMAIFSVCRQWPFGQLRMNIFVIFYVLFPPLFILDELGKVSVKLGQDRGMPRRRSAAAAGGAAPRTVHLSPLVALIVWGLMLIQFPLDYRAFSHRRPTGSWQASAEALQHILDVYTAGPQIPLVSNHLGQAQFSYYSRHHRQMSARYGRQAALFAPRGMRTRSSAFYLRGEMLRVCQESRQAAIYMAHYLAPESMIYRNDFCIEHDSRQDLCAYSCLVTSEIYDAARRKRQLFPQRRFSGKGNGWEQVYISPPLNIEGAQAETLVVFNFDFDFHTANKWIKLAFLDENNASGNFAEPEIDYDHPIHSDHLESAASVKLIAPVESVRMSIWAKGTYDFTVSGLDWFVVNQDAWEAPGRPFRIVEEMCERIRLLRRVTAVDHFWDSRLEDFGWTRGNAVIRLDNVDIEPEERVFMLETYGWMEPEIRDEIVNRSLKIYFNFTHRAPLIKIEGQRAVKCYFQVPADIRTVTSITINSRTFVPREHGINDDGRDLGVDVKSIGFPRIVFEEQAPGGSP